MAVVLLAAGAWCNLRSARAWQRFLALFTGLILAMAVAAVGNEILCARPAWGHSGLFTWQTEAMSSVIMCGWLVAAIFALALLALIPRLDEHPHAEEAAV